VTYFHVASTALLIYDYFLTLPREVSLIWPSKWSLIKVLFLLTRYTPFIDAGLSLHYHFQSSPRVETCQLVVSLNSCLFFSGTAASQIILTMRTWAVWDRNKQLGIALGIFFAMCALPDIGIIVIFLKSLRFIPLKSPALLGCLVIEASPYLSISWILLLIYEAGIFFLMLIEGIRCYKLSSNSQLFRVVFKNGLLYYLYLFALSLCNVIVVKTVPPHLQVVLIFTERVVHSILACRVVLEIRGQVTKSILLVNVLDLNVVPNEQKDMGNRRTYANRIVDYETYSASWRT